MPTVARKQKGRRARNGVSYRRRPRSVWRRTSITVAGRRPPFPQVETCICAMVEVPKSTTATRTAEELTAVRILLRRLSYPRQKNAGRTACKM